MAMWEAVMHRYRIPSFEFLLEHWNRGQLYLAMDLAHWNGRKKRDEYLPPLIAFDPKTLRASDVFKLFGFGDLM